MQRLRPVILAVLLVSAAPPQSADDLSREADAAVGRKDWVAAERFYAAAAERTADPGLVAFNRGTLLFAREEYREAELCFVRCLGDAAIPPDRKARALFNRGACLLKRGGPAAVFRVAILSFEGCLDLQPPDAPLITDTKRNLELAKLLWAEARAKDATPERPNDPPPEDKPDRTPSKPDTVATDTRPDATGGSDATGQQGRVATTSGAAEGPADGTGQKAPGSGTLPVLTDADGVQKLTPEDTQTYLARIAARIEKDRRDTARLVAGPDRKTVRDW